MLWGIEAGGTKFICAVGDEVGRLVERIQIPTTVPKETMPKVIFFLTLVFKFIWAVNPFSNNSVHPHFFIKTRRNDCTTTVYRQLLPDADIKKQCTFCVRIR